MKHILQILFIVLASIQTKETTLENDLQESLEVYNRFNNIETVSQSKSFMINSTKKSIAYFDSFDDKAIFYISENYEDYISHKDERITGKFYPIESNTTYYIRNFIWSSPTVLTKYFLPILNDDEEIKINDDIEEINFIYLEANKTYTLDFSENKNQKMIKLSYRTLNSKVDIKINEIKEAELNEKERYYEIKENFKGKIQLEIKENNAFIEFLTDTGDYTIFPNTTIEETEVDKDILIITVEKNPKKFKMRLNSVENFNYSLSYGLSNNSHYYYYSKNNTKINSKFYEGYNYIGYVELMSVFRNKNLLQDEFISFTVILERKPGQKIYLEYKQTCLLDKIYDEEMSEENCTKIINNLKDLLEIYVYTDIAKNPPIIENYPNYHHKPIDLKAELDKVSKINRKFYEFYQEIEKILTATRDLHFNIFAHQTPKGVQFGQYFVTLPFKFEIGKDKNDTHRIFIKKNNYFNYTDNSTKEFINTHLDIPLKAINGINPFDYIQNWSQYRRTKNPHAQFSNVIDTVTSFSLCYYPVDYSELYNEYEFDDNNSLKLFYLNNFENINDNDKEFNEYFLKVFQNKKSPYDMPNYDIIRDEFLISKGLKQRKKLLKEEKIKWDVYYENVENNFAYYLKCRFDEKNKVNVLVQNSFNINVMNAYSKVLECFEIFYSNEYPIIIIEDHNGGGYANLLIFMHQILQLRLTDRSYESFRISDISKNYFNSKKWDFVDIETCQHGTFFNETAEITDHYNYNGLNIEHKRTKVIDRYPRALRNAFNNIREEYFNSSFLKKPTDIIIFTDSYSYSSTSGFIKGFQSTGGAIVVGYYGNPTKSGTDFFDSSQSDSDVQNLEKTEMYKSLNEVGITITGVTCGESYDDFYQKKNPIPREYTLEPVDYRVDIYSRYSDEIYDTFINEGIEVHKLFNNGSYCNAKNDKLLLHDDKCYTIEGDQFAHGGYKCNSSSKWDTEKCVGYYCDIGYYYDHVENKCKKECPYDENKKYYLIYGKKFNKEYNIKQNNIAEFQLLSYEGYYYSFETSEKSIGKFPQFLFVKNFASFSVENEGDTILPLKIKAVDPNLNPNISFEIFSVRNILIKFKNFQKTKGMYFFQCKEDSILYGDNILNLTNGEMKIAKYNNNMKSESIIQISNQYFSDIQGKIFSLEKNQLYIVYLNFQEKEEIDFYLSNLPSEIISVKSYENNVLYLKKNKNYTIDFNNFDEIFAAIKLSRKTLNSEVIIKDANIILSSNNLYYILEKNFTGKINLTIEKEDALIEILVKMDGNYSETIDFEGKTNLTLSKLSTLIQIPKNLIGNDLMFILNKEGNSRIYIYQDYSIPGYFVYYPVDDKNNEIILSNFTFNITKQYENDIKLMENEYYYIIIQTYDSYSNISVNMYNNKRSEDKNDDTDNTDNNDNNDNGLKTWHIILIVVGSILVVAGIIIIICCIKKKKILSEEIEDKAKGLTVVE